MHDRATGAVQRVSVGPDGAEATGSSFSPQISGHGRFVAFLADAADLVPGDSNRVRDVFVHDRVLGKTVRASVNTAGWQADRRSLDHVMISANGGRIAFAAHASNLAPGDTNNALDVFLRERW